MIDNATMMFMHLDKLRFDAKIAVKEFCEGVCDRRQYSRYLCGNQRVSVKKLVKFCEKINLNEIEFYYSFYSNERSSFYKINSLYVDLIKRDIIGAKKKIDELSKINFSDSRTSQFFKMCKLYYLETEGKEPLHYLVSRYKKLINFPECLSKKIFNFVEIATLRLILNIEYKDGNTDILEFLRSKLLDRSYLFITGDSRFILPSIYSSVGRILCILKRYEDAKKILEYGISYSHSIGDNYAITHMYYYISFTYYKLGNDILCKEYSTKTLMSAYSKEDAMLFNTFKKMIYKDYGYSVSYLLENNIFS